MADTSPRSKSGKARLRWGTAALAWAALVLATPALGDAAQSATAPTNFESPAGKVSYSNLEGFSELHQFASRDRRWAEELARYILRAAGARLTAGQRIDVVVTDVQLAGMYRPWLPGPLADVRVVSDTTPPRIDLSFRVETAQGAVVKEGVRRLRDLDFMSHRYQNANASYRFEKNLIDDWLRNEF